MGTAPTIPSGPGEYQKFMIGLVGEADPEVIQAATPARVKALVDRAGDGLRKRPGPGEWSTVELLGHMFDAEVASSARYRFILGHDRPRLEGYSQDAWVSAQAYNDADPQVLLTALHALREANLGLWRRASEVQRDRVGVHLERGEESLRFLFTLMAAHDLYHTTQMEGTLASVRGGA
ncbi:MAG: DinB family protein [Candidatus Dormibacteria bacterium]